MHREHLSTHATECTVNMCRHTRQNAPWTSVDKRGRMHREHVSTHTAKYIVSYLSTNAAEYTDVRVYQILTKAITAIQIKLKPCREP